MWITKFGLLLLYFITVSAKNLSEQNKNVKAIDSQNIKDVIGTTKIVHSKKFREEIIKRGKNLKMYICKYKAETPKGKKKYRCKSIKRVDGKDIKSVLKNDALKSAGNKIYDPWVFDILSTKPDNIQFIHPNDGPMEGTTIPPELEEYIWKQDQGIFDNFDYEYEYYDDPDNFQSEEKETIKKASSDVRKVLKMTHMLEKETKAVKKKVRKRSSGEEPSYNFDYDQIYDGDENGKTERDTEETYPELEPKEAPQMNSFINDVSIENDGQEPKKKTWQEKQKELMERFPDIFAGSVDSTGHFAGKNQMRDESVISGPIGAESIANINNKETESGNSKNDETFQKNYSYEDYYDMSPQIDDQQEVQISKQNRFQMFNEKNTDTKQAKNKEDEMHYDYDYDYNSSIQQQSNKRMFGGKKLNKNMKMKSAFVEPEALEQVFKSSKQFQQQPYSKSLSEGSLLRSIEQPNYQVASNENLAKFLKSSLSSQQTNGYQQVGGFTSTSTGGYPSTGGYTSYQSGRSTGSYQQPNTMNKLSRDTIMASSHTPQSSNIPNAMESLVNSLYSEESPSQKAEAATLLNTLLSGSYSDQSTAAKALPDTSFSNYEDPYSDYYSSDESYLTDNYIDPDYTLLTEQLATLTSQIKELANHQTQQQTQQFSILQKHQQELLQQSAVLAQQKQALDQQKMELEKQKQIAEQKKQEAVVQQKELERQRLYLLQEQQKKQQQQYIEQQKQQYLEQQQQKYLEQQKQQLLQQQQQQQQQRLIQQQQQQSAVAQYPPTATPSPFANVPQISEQSTTDLAPPPGVDRVANLPRRRQQQMAGRARKLGRGLGQRRMIGPMRRRAMMQRRRMMNMRRRRFGGNPEGREANNLKENAGAEESIETQVISTTNDVDESQFGPNAHVHYEYVVEGEDSSNENAFATGINNGDEEEVYDLNQITGGDVEGYHTVPAFAQNRQRIQRPFPQGPRRRRGGFANRRVRRPLRG